MFNSPIIDFSISLIFLFLLFSLLVSWIMEFIASRFNRKGRHLKKMLYALLGGDDTINWTSRLYNHPLIESLSVKYNRITSYIPEDTFAEVIDDLIVEMGRDYTIKQDPDTGEYVYKEEKGKYDQDLKKGLTNMPDSDLKRTLQMFYDQSGENFEGFTQAVKNWYKEYMARVNHTYGRKLRKPLIIIGCIIALSFNVDFFHITNRLWVDANLRESIVVAAESFHDKYEDINSLELSKKFFKDYDNSLDLPIGWGEEVKKAEIGEEAYYEKNMFQRGGMIISYYLHADSCWWLILIKLMGFLTSGFIVAFGAPFWFDLLKKAVSFKKIVKSKS
ncbi:MAG: hypothetical protein KAJ50_04545 [Bacteroidales bacterium]|nr:hypothetical protein [Bacteroidales bacterium]